MKTSKIIKSKVFGPNSWEKRIIPSFVGENTISCRETMHSAGSAEVYIRLGCNGSKRGWERTLVQQIRIQFKSCNAQQTLTSAFYILAEAPILFANWEFAVPQSQIFTQIQTFYPPPPPFFLHSCWAHTKMSRQTFINAFPLNSSVTQTANINQ